MMGGIKVLAAERYAGSITRVTERKATAVLTAQAEEDNATALISVDEKAITLALAIWLCCTMWTRS